MFDAEMGSTRGPFGTPDSHTSRSRFSWRTARHDNVRSWPLSVAEIQQDHRLFAVTTGPTATQIPIGDEASPSRQATRFLGEEPFGSRKAVAVNAIVTYAFGVQSRDVVAGNGVDAKLPARPPQRHQAWGAMGWVPGTATCWAP